MIEIFDDDFGASKYQRYFSRSVNDYLDSLDIKVVDILDKYVESCLKDNAFSLMDMKDWTIDWTKKMITEARKWYRNER